MKNYLLTALSIAFIASSVSGGTSAQPATQEQMTYEALVSITREVGVEVNNKRVSESNLKNQQLMRERSENEEISGQIVFANGLTARELSALADSFGLEVIRAEIKHPIGDRGQVATMSIGGFNLNMIDGSLEERLEIAAGEHRFRLAGVLMNQGDPSDPQYDVVNAPTLLFYKVEVITVLSSIELLESDENVAAVFLDESNRRIDNYRSFRERIESTKVITAPQIRRRLAEGLPPGVSPERVIWNYSFPMPRAQ